MVVPSILQRILQRKSEEVAAGQSLTSMTELAAKAKDCAPTRGFENGLRQALAKGRRLLRKLREPHPVPA